ncbi:phosphatidylserine/phosphatidylglycerophosphate/cardiolipin synthase family protein [Streptomyces sp. NPDC012888]|uniref:phospholipase D-like domain-containing protein n=1 Tax=Streptomyces sp. NPDC012888 TaxID=3364855 RepID=UPI003690EA86
MRMRALGRIAATTALAAVASLVTASGAQSADYTVRNPAFTLPATPDAVFNNPRSGDPDKINNRLVDLIDHAKPGTRISGSMYSFTDGRVRSALIAAYREGVKVQLVLDSDALKKPTQDWYSQTNRDVDQDGSEFAPLLKELGSDRSKDSFVYVCPRNRGCIGARTEAEIGKNPINHNKFFLFEETAGVRDVVFQSSANLVESQRLKFFNNAVTVPSPELYATYSGYFQDLQTFSTNALGETHVVNEGTPDEKEVADKDYYGNRPPAAGTPYAAYFSPREESSTPGVHNDSVLDMLAPVSCAGGATKVRVAMYAFTRLAVAERLAELKAAGCKVYVFLNDEPGSIGSAVRAKLKAANLNHLGTCNADPRFGLHSKYLLVEGTYGGTPNKSLVFTGSHNYTQPSLRGHDETVVKIDDQGVYGKFEDNFDRELNGFPGYDPARTGLCTPMAA